MDAKLIKTGNEYLLKDLKGEVLAITSGSKEGRMLSLKNCQAIENGYDLDELADEFSRKFPNDSEPIRYASFIIGFQKALSILGDKKFSEQDVRDAYFHGEKDSYTKGGQTKEMENECIQSLQQTEWDVEIVEDTSILWQFSEPKLDQNGCLILKRI